tara:strand:+ start:39559 stop:40530 length:972 start_codon:yes stop_codon:yes gene_type:complete
LWHKSALGKVISEDCLHLTDAEVIFCHEHRNIELPHEEWMIQCMNRNPTILDEYTILESLRKPGNKIMITVHSDGFNLNEERETWGLRWPSDAHPRDSKPISEIRWFHSSERLDIVELLNWASSVRNKKRIAEVLIIDNELSVVTYHIEIVEPRGIFDIPTKEDYMNISNIEGKISLSNGNVFIPNNEDWKYENIGIPHNNGRIIDEDIEKMIENKINGKGKDMSISEKIVLDLLERGLHPRPGFKYGSKWRCYETSIEEDHAPWLVVHPDNGPENWEEACLISRLASGVNKKWLFPIMDKSWHYLSIIRPPTDSRWNNPIRR